MVWQPNGAADEPPATYGWRADGKKVLPDGPGTRQQAGLIAVAVPG